MFPTWFKPTRAQALGLVLLVAVLSHAPALRCGFIWLDHGHIIEGLALPPHGASAGDWLSLFTHGFAGTGFYRPLVSLSLSIDAAFGGSALLYHAVTLGWHAVAAALIVLAGEALGLTLGASLIAGLLFAAHPVTSEVACAIAFRSESMATAALLLLLVMHIERRPLGAACALLAGALTKETALALGPLVILVWELSNRSSSTAENAGTAQRRKLLVAEASALLAACALRLLFAPAWRAAAPGLSLSEAVATRLATLEKSFIALFALGDRTLGDAFPVGSLASVHALAGAVLALCVAYLAYQRRGVALLFALSLLPSLQLIPVMRWWSPHYLYTPLAFAAILAGELLDHWAAPAADSDGAPRAWRSPLPWSGLAVTLCAGLSFVDASRFESDETLWSREATLHPACREAQFFLGEAARERKDFAQAERRYELAIAETPGYLSYVDLKAAYANLGVARLEQHRPAEAVTAFRAALPLATSEQEHRQLSHDVATAALMSGDAVTAARELEAETRRPDALPQSLMVRAQALLLLGRAEDARVLQQRLAGPRYSGNHLP